MLQTFAALAEPNRFRIIELLRTGERSVNDIVHRLRLPQPQVSKHLRVLRESGLVDVAPRGQQRLYAIHGEALRACHVWLERYRKLWEHRFDAMDRVVQDLKQKEKSHDRRAGR
jgi:DNA-binding transcriptional ArsR family regulator